MPDIRAETDALSAAAPLKHHRASPGEAVQTPHAHVAWALRVAIALIVPLIIALALLGAYASFTAIRDLAHPRFGTRAWTIPIGIDVGILTLLAGDLLLEYLGIGWVVLRWVAWGFIGCTIYLNFASIDHDPPAAVMQVAMPVLFIVALEGVRHLIRRTSGLTGDTRIDKIPWARRCYAPVTSLMLHRRMVLWHVRDYREGLRLEYAHLRAVSDLQQHYGRWLWRWKAPLHARLALRLQDAHQAGLDTAETGPPNVPISHPTAAPGNRRHGPRETHARPGGPSPHRAAPGPRLAPTTRAGAPIPEDPRRSPAASTSTPADIPTARKAPKAPPSHPNPKDRELVNAAREIAQELQADGSRLSQVALADRLRQQGFGIANDRLRWLIGQVDAAPDPASPEPVSLQGDTNNPSSVPGGTP